MPAESYYLYSPYYNQALNFHLDLDVSSAIFYTITSLTLLGIMGSMLSLSLAQDEIDGDSNDATKAETVFKSTVLHKTFTKNELYKEDNDDDHDDDDEADILELKTEVMDRLYDLLDRLPQELQHFNVLIKDLNDNFTLTSAVELYENLLQELATINTSHELQSAINSYYQETLKI
jgi:hypothetical protein